MTNITLASLRNSTTFFNIDDVVTIVNGRKNEEVGFFVPKIFKEEFEKFANSLEKKRKKELLRKVALASKKDIIGDGAISDGIN